MTQTNLGTLSTCDNTPLVHKTSMNVARFPAWRWIDGLGKVAETLLSTLGRYEVVESTGRRRLTIVHFGDHAEAYRRFAQGGEETYYAQRYSVDFVASLAARKDVESLTAISLSADLPDIELPSGVRTLGIDLYPKGRLARSRELVSAVAKTRPTHLIVMSPCIPLIAWGIRARIPVLPMFADSFRKHGIVDRIRYLLLRLLLNHPSIALVANHNLAASLDLERIGVDRRKIVPFDWPPLISPRSYEAKSAPPADRPFRLVYVGSLLETKGVGDAILAVSELCKRGRRVELTIIGTGDQEGFERLAVAQGTAGQVHFLGPKAHSEVLAAMRNHDAVVVPSHWAYPEGLPMTIYEALCTRSPLLASDHPMFALKIRDRRNALVFPERNPMALAQRIDELASSPQLYAELSNAGAEAEQGYLCPLKYDRLISDFLDPARRAGLLEYSLANHAYR